MGGVYVRAYAIRYPEEVVGMVLVDTSHEEQELRFPTAFSELNRKARAQMAQFLMVPRLVNSLGLLAMYPEDYPGAYLPPLPEAVEGTYKGVILSDTRYFAAVAEQYYHVEDNFAEMREMHITTLGDIPLVVLSAARLEIPEAYGLSGEETAQVQTTWDEMQAELAGLSSRGERVIAEESSHYIQFDQPGLVVEAINHVLDAQ
jgi:pimeloyl-ACP methyl ester carboxylesterase